MKGCKNCGFVDHFKGKFYCGQAGVSLFGKTINPVQVMPCFVKPDSELTLREELIEYYHNVYKSELGVRPSIENLSEMPIDCLATMVHEFIRNMSDVPNQ